MSSRERSDTGHHSFKMVYLSLCCFVGVAESHLQGHKVMAVAPNLGVLCNNVGEAIKLHTLINNQASLGTVTSSATIDALQSVLSQNCDISLMLKVSG